MIPFWSKARFDEFKETIVDGFFGWRNGTLPNPTFMGNDRRRERRVRTSKFSTFIHLIILGVAELTIYFL
jgi:hypothetical protein